MEKQNEWNAALKECRNQGLASLVGVVGIFFKTTKSIQVKKLQNHSIFNNMSYATAILFVTLLSIVSSCKKDRIEHPSLNNNTAFIDTLWKTYPLDTLSAEIDDASRATSTPPSSYVSVPDVNSYQSSPTSTVTANGVSYYGGPFQSCTYSISGSTILFKVKRTDGYTFPSGSIIKVWKSLGGTVKASATVASAATTVTVNITETNTWNLSGGSSSNANNFNDYILTWYNPASGYTFYTRPIKIVAVPLGWGIYLTSLNGTSVYSNGWGGFSSTNYLTDTWGQKYQCVHFVKRYYLTVFNKSIGNGNADVYWKDYTAHNLKTKVLNGSGIPQMGDIICFSSSSGSYHVGIVGGVVSGKLRVFQENVGQTKDSFLVGNYCSGYKDFSFTSSSNGYNVSASALSNSWTTLGWLR